MGKRLSDLDIIDECRSLGLKDIVIYREEYKPPRVSYICTCGAKVQNKNWYKIKHENQFLCKACSDDIRSQAQIKYSKKVIKGRLSEVSNDKPIKINEGIKSVSEIHCESCSTVYYIRNEEIFASYFKGHPDCSYKLKIKSKGEYFIKELLDSYNINYLHNKSFKSLGIDSLLRFDFYLPNFNLIIEFDGIQHFSKKELKRVGYNINSSKFTSRKDLFKDQRLRDFTKNHLCLDNDINILRIPAWHLGKLKEILLPIFTREDVIEGLYYTDDSFYKKGSRRLI